MGSRLGRIGAEALDIDPEERAQAEKALANLANFLREAPEKAAAVFGDIEKLQKEYPDKKDFIMALRARVMAYGVVLGEFPGESESEEAPRKDFAKHKLDGPLTARIGMLQGTLRTINKPPGAGN